jgi:phage terminase large subunit GpA-like protein
MAIKGANTPGKPILAARPTAVDVNHRGKVIKGGAQLWMVGSDTAKHTIFNLLASDADCAPGERRMRFSQDLEQSYYDGLVSEVFDPEKNRWVKRRGKRNEPLDTEVYAIAASMHPDLRVHAMRRGDWDRLQAALEPAQQAPEAQAHTEPSAAPGQAKRGPRRRQGSGFVGGWK